MTVQPLQRGEHHGVLSCSVLFCPVLSSFVLFCSGSALGSGQGVGANPPGLSLVLFRVFCSISWVLLNLHVGPLLWHYCDAALGAWPSQARHTMQWGCADLLYLWWVNLYPVLTLSMPNDLNVPTHKGSTTSMSAGSTSTPLSPSTAMQCKLVLDSMTCTRKMSRSCFSIALEQMMPSASGWKRPSDRSNPG